MMKRVVKGHCNGCKLNTGEEAIKYQIIVSGVIVLDEMLPQMDQFEYVWILMVNN